MILVADARSLALRSFILTSAISASFERLMVPALTLPGSFEPDLRFAAFFRRKLAGGVNIMEFCKAFNASTQELEKNMPIPTVITVYADRSFSFTTKTPPASFLLKKAAKIKSGSKEPSKVSAGTIKRSQLTEIAEAKMKDLNANDLASATKIIEGSARAMGLQVVEG